MKKTSTLDDKNLVKKLDPHNVLGSIDLLAKQVEHAWQETNKLKINLKNKINNVVVMGMGGSGLGAHVIKTVFKDELKVPFDFYNSYTLPGYVGPNTLVILASYSGNTEEVLSAAKLALKTKAQVVVISAGGKLIKLAQENSWGYYQIDPKYNPSGQPRIALGYAITGLIAILNKLNLLEISNKEIDLVISEIKSQVELNKFSVPQDENPAKLLSLQLYDFRPILVSAQHLAGAIHVSANQFNENAKIYADYKVVPEINHHLLEGLKFPLSNASSHVFVLINSTLFSKKNQQRIKLTQEVVAQNDILTTSINLTGKNKLAEAFGLIAFFSYVTFYLSLVEGIDAAKIPFVDWFKEQLG